LSITHVCCFSGFCLSAYFSWNLDIIILPFVHYRTEFCYWNVFIRMKFSILCKSIEKWKYEKKLVYNKVNPFLYLWPYWFIQRKRKYPLSYFCVFIVYVLSLSWVPLNQIMLSIWHMFLNSLLNNEKFHVISIVSSNLLWSFN